MDANVDEANREALDGVMRGIGQKARAAASVLARAPRSQKDAALLAGAEALVSDTDDILAENAKDIAAGTASGMAQSFLDRLTLTPERIAAMADGLRAVAALEDPVGTALASWTRPNGLDFTRVRTPLGVIGVIYESRPNVTADAGALCLKSGNAAILRGGSDSLHSSSAILARMAKGLRAADLPEAAIQQVPTRDRAAVGMMLKGLGGAIDVIVPRGGRSLVERIHEEARVPVFSHLEGICHIYVDRAADAAMAKEIIVNAKMRRTGICGAAECVLVHRDVADAQVPVLVEALSAAGCSVRGDSGVCALSATATAASSDDWGREFLDAIIAMRVVDDMDQAMSHIATFGSSHTESIVTDDPDAAERFLNTVDSAIVMHNASTQFADGGEFGMGAEIGIATGRMHARGPVGLEQLTSFNYRVRGSGQTRP
ncbi:MAG: glutamate-5-semialdehyde dehydrogenase [Pseudomonadota bacterium]